jgi:cathepsin L
MSYSGQNYPCNQTGRPSVSTIASFVEVPSNDEQALVDAVAINPVAITVDASAWGMYESGIFDSCNTSSPTLDHGVQLVGYDSDDGTDFWIVRNSWSPDWGEGGFINIFKGANSTDYCGWDVNPKDGTGCDDGPDKVYVCGMCGILYDNVYPVVK